MKKIAYVMVALALASCYEGMAKTSAPKTPEEKAALQLKMMQKTGGVVMKPGVGCIAVVNCQKDIDLTCVDGVSERLRRAIKVPIVRKASDAFNFMEAEKSVVASGGKAALFVVDDPKMPLTLYSPEAKWGMMNVALLKKDKPSAEVLEARVKKLFIRSFCTTLGGGASKYSISPSKPMFSVADIDALVGSDDFCVDTVMAMNQYVPGLGLTQEKHSTYRRACLEGWAPAPTNDFQRAIWAECKKPENQFKKDFPELSK